MEKEINRWYKKLWETRGARFIAAKRLEMQEKWSTITISLISVYIVALNLTILLPERHSVLSNENITFSTICLSIFVLVISLILSSKDYKLRAAKFHDCGREINEVYDRVCLWKNSNANPSIEEIQNVSKEYNSILNKYDNHSTLDDLMFRSDNLSDFEDKVKYPIIFWIQVKTRYYFNTIIGYWVFILTPIIIYLIFNAVTV